MRSNKEAPEESQHRKDGKEPHPTLMGGAGGWLTVFI